jgi:hypothetical protein
MAAAPGSRLEHRAGAALYHALDTGCVLTVAGRRPLEPQPTSAPHTLAGR